MPKKTISVNGKTLSFEEKYEIGDVTEENYKDTATKFKSLKERPENVGKTDDEIFDLLYDQEKSATLNDLNKANSVEEQKLEEQIKGFENYALNRVYQERLKAYESQREDKISSERRAFGDKLKIPRNQVVNVDKIARDFFVKYYGEDFLKENPDLTYEELAGNLSASVDPNNPRVFEYKKSYAHVNVKPEDRDTAISLFEYYATTGDINRSYNGIALQEAKDDTATFDKYLKTETNYVNVKKQLDTAKENHRKENERIAEERLKFSETRKFKDKLKSDQKDFANIIKERNELDKQYKATNVFSRIARWILPNSWSDAGKIQNQIDALDKAVKEAGYNEKDIESAQERITKETPYGTDLERGELSQLSNMAKRFDGVDSAILPGNVKNIIDSIDHIVNHKGVFSDGKSNYIEILENESTEFIEWYNEKEMNTESFDEYKKFAEEVLSFVNEIKARENPTVTTEENAPVQNNEITTEQLVENLGKDTGKLSVNESISQKQTDDPTIQRESEKGRVNE